MAASPRLVYEPRRLADAGSSRDKRDAAVAPFARAQRSVDLAQRHRALDQIVRRITHPVSIRTERSRVIDPRINQRRTC